MIAFHGSDHIVEKPQYGAGKRTNDYGRGFYTTESVELAKEWACARNTNGFANRYLLDVEGLDILNLNAPVYYEKKALRDRDARRQYRLTRHDSDGPNELYMLDIMREGMGHDDPRLR